MAEVKESKAKDIEAKDIEAKDIEAKAETKTVLSASTKCRSSDKEGRASGPFIEFGM